MQVDETFHRLKQTFAQTRFVGATGWGGNQVHVALAHQGAFGGEHQTPAGALPFGKGVVLAIGKALAFEFGNQHIGGQGLQQVILEAALVLPLLLLFGLFMQQRDLHARHEDGFGAQQMHQFAHGQLRGFEILGVGPNANRGARAFLARFGIAHLQGRSHITVGETQGGHFAIAAHAHLQPVGQGVGDAHPHPMQTAREAVGAALAFVEFATSVQPGEHQFHHRGFLFGMQAKGNASAVVFNAHRTVGVQGDVDALAEPRQGFVGGVIQDLLNDVQRVIGAGVHPRPLLHRFKSLEDADRVLGVFVSFRGHGRGL